VKKGWQLEQISTVVSLPKVDMDFQEAPQEQLKVVGLYSGWIPDFIIFSKNYLSIM